MTQRGWWLAAMTILPTPISSASASRPCEHRSSQSLIERLPAGPSILDLGCGAGIPVARDLVRIGFNVTGVDASRGRVQCAIRNVPQARFVLEDMASVQFAPSTFDAGQICSSLFEGAKERLPRCGGNCRGR